MLKVTRMSTRRQEDRRRSCRRYLDLWSLLVFLISFQVFVCTILLPVLMLTGGSRRLCEYESIGEDIRLIKVRRDPETNARWGKFATSVPDVQGVTDSIKVVTTKTPSRPVVNFKHLSHIPRPFTILTTTNMGFAEFAVNWLKSIRRLGIDYNVTIIAEDMDAFRYLKNLTFNDRNLSIVKTEYGTSSPKAQKFMFSGYRRLVNKRPQHLLDKLEDGFDILLADVDSFWFKNPLDLVIPNYEKYDLWLAKGHDGKDGHPLPCPCLMYLKSDIKSFGVVKHWISRLLRANGMESDQQSLNYVLKTRHGKRMRIGWLDAGEIPTGDNYKKRRENNESMEDVFVYHANHMGDAPRKKTYMKSIGLWGL